MGILLKWDFEEALLLIDLYQCWSQQDDKNNDDIISSLSHLLNNRAIELGYVVDDKFRNITGIKMKLQNIAYIASNEKSGLSGYSDMDMKAYNFSLEYPSEFANKVTDIKSKYNSAESSINVDKDILKVEEINDTSSLSELYFLQSDEYEDIDVVNLPISIRVVNCLKTAGIRNVCDLLNHSYSQLAAIRGFGAKCKKDVHFYLLNITNHELSEKIKPKTTTKLSSFIFANKERLINGDFSFCDEQSLSSFDSDLISRYKESYDVLGAKLVSACYNRPTETLSLISALSSFSAEVDQLYKQKHDIESLIWGFPKNREKNKVIGYINAYTSDENQRTSLLNSLPNSDSTFSLLSLNESLSDVEYINLKKFLKWCSFDMADELEQLFDRLYAKDNMRIVIQNRAICKTLDQIGTELGVTRERIRQIEAKAKRTFAQWQRLYRIVLKISAERNGDTILTPLEIEDFCGKYATEMLYFLKSFESGSYVYDSQLDVFIVENGSVSERLQEFIENLPDIFNQSNLSDIYEMAEECDDIPQELLERAILDEYKLTGNTYHRSRLSLSKMYSAVLDKFYPNGIKAYDETELSVFRKHIIETYGDVRVPENSRAITARIASIGILCGKGMYKPKTDKYISKSLLEKIHNYITQSTNSIFLTNTLFSEFEDELITEVVNNKYHLQGILHEVYGNEFVFHRDYISKDDSSTSIYAEIVRFIKQSDYPVNKKQLQAAFPGVTEIVFSFAIADPNVLNFFGEYLYATKFRISNDERTYLLRVAENLISDNNAHHCKEAFDSIMKDKPEILLRNAAAQPFCVYSIFEYFFREQFQFSRPYIAKLGMDIGRPGERLHDMIYSSDEIAISDISDFEKENHYQITSLLDFLISQNSDYLIADDNTLISIASSGITSEVANAIEGEICYEVSDTLPIYQLQCAGKFPQINIPWTDWLVFSVLKKWASRLDVGVSNNKFRYANPLVSLQGKMDEEKFKPFARNQGTLVLADNLDNIDDLIARYIENEVVL